MQSKDFLILAGFTITEPREYGRHGSYSPKTLVVDISLDKFTLKDIPLVDIETDHQCIIRLFFRKMYKAMQGNDLYFRQWQESTREIDRIMDLVEKIRPCECPEY